MKKLLFVVLTLLCADFSWSQVVLENNPPNLKWRKIQTPNFRVVFPKGFETQAQRVASTLEHIRDEEAKSLGSLPRRISIVLQNQSAESNGFVSILPRRSEFYTMPSQDYNFTGTNDWLDLLASHEYRHIVQYQHATRGFNRLLYYVFGATTLAGMSSVAAPDWFWEGDAVVTETAFTPSGRGKIPNFSLLFRTNLLEGREFNYHKQYLRSYKHNIPDHYVLGYHMVSYLRRKTNDPEIWGRITKRSWSVPFIPFAFSNSVHSESGLYVTDLYKEMVADLKQRWKAQIDTLQLTQFERVSSPRNNVYTDYLYPQPMADGVVAMKTGIGDIAQFVWVGSNGNERIFTPGFINDSGMISGRGNIIIWTEYGYHPRWNVKNYSLIKAYDLSSTKRIVIGDRHARYGSAAISPDQSKIAAVHTSPDYKTELRVLSFPGGQVLGVVLNEANDFYSMPKWSEDGKYIVVLKTNKQGRSVVSIDASSFIETTLINPSQENIGYPTLAGNILLFNSPMSGIDNIYALDVATGKRYNVTSSKYGAYNPGISTDGKYIYYNEQTRDGFDVVKIPFDIEGWKEVSSPIRAENLYDEIIEQEGHPDLVTQATVQNFPVKKFSRLTSLINPYSWGAFIDNSLTTANIGISSQDLLSTTRLDAGYVFDINERTGTWRASASYQGFFPILDLSASLGDRKVTEEFEVGEVDLEWREQNIAGAVRLPLVTTSSKFAGNVTIANEVGLTRVSELQNSFDGGGRVIDGDLYLTYQGDGDLIYNETSFSAFRLLKRARRDINSKWGQSVFVSYKSTPYAGDYSAGLLAMTGVLYVPGFFKHHSIWARGSYQQTELILDKKEPYIFRNAIPLPRGHEVSRYLDFYTIAVNYTLPVWYPDISLGPLVNVQRLRANAFYDYGLGKSRTLTATYSSVGVETKLDINVLRFLPQFDIGFRYSWAIETQQPRFELLIGTINF